MSSTGRQVTHQSDELMHLSEDFLTEFRVLKMPSTGMRIKTTYKYTNCRAIRQGRIHKVMEEHCNTAYLEGYRCEP